jgi:ubiquinone/menaquinone biosynthesis C-methylase UbiE
VALKRVDYDEHQHAVYAAGRALSAAALDAWMQAWAAHLPAPRPLTLVDLGSGIGRFTPALAGAFGGPVFGVEPSAKMRAIAIAAGPQAGVRYLEGDAAHIPLDDHAVDGVLMFLSYHHVPDREAAAVEIARVLRPGGRVLIQGGFSDRMGVGSWWHQFFPRAWEVERDMFPSTGQTIAAFAGVGLSPKGLHQIQTRFFDSVAQAAERLRLRPYSTFEHLTEAEIAEGQARLDAAAAADVDDRPIEGPSDLMVLG